jgi:hypothetical protein
MHVNRVPARACQDGPRLIECLAHRALRRPTSGEETSNGGHKPNAPA